MTTVSLPVPNRITQFLLSFQSSLRGVLKTLKNAKINKFVVLPDACDVLPALLGKVNASNAASVGAAFLLVLRVFVKRNFSKVRPDVVGSIPVNVVYAYRPAVKHKERSDPVSRIYLSEHSEVGVSLNVDVDLDGLTGVSGVVLSAPAFRCVRNQFIVAWLKHVWCSLKPRKVSRCWVVLNSPLNQIIYVCHNLVRPCCFDTKYTLWRSADQGA